MTNKIALKSHEVDTTYSRMKKILLEGRKAAFISIGKTELETYWKLGKEIIETEQKGAKRAEYGPQLIKQLSQRFKEDGEKYHERTLRRFRLFYLAYPIWTAVRSELTWTHYRSLTSIEDEEKRQFYTTYAIQEKLSTRALDNEINALSYERLVLGTGKADSSKLEKKNFEIHKPGDVIKDPYVFDFLGVPEKGRELKESGLEQAIIDKIQDFLIELGRGFAFVRRQYRISDGHKHYYIDLVFFNYILNRFFVIELKVRELNHKDIGQLDFYVKYFDGEVKSNHHKQTVGMILSTSKNETIVKYSVLNDSDSLFASEYKLYLPKEIELKSIIESERSRIEDKINNKTDNDAK